MQDYRIMSIYIIAEAGVNHNGNVELACQLANAAKHAGADCVKFQTFKAENLVLKSAGKAAYQKEQTGGGSQLEMLQKLQLSFEDFVALKKNCDQIGVTFLSTPFDLESVDFLNELGVPFWKIPSGEITNYPYLVALARTGKDIVMSTGMCEMEEIREAIDLLQDQGAGTIRLLHCNTEYPTPFSDVNLRAMETMRETFGVEVGFSDHTPGIEIPVAAAALGATIIEKHFTLDKNMEGPDHKASLNPDELSEMVRCIRHVEQAVGDGVKKPSASETKNIPVARKSIVAARPIKAGETFTEENLTTKRPGTGISAMRWAEVLGQVAKQDFDEDELITL